MRPDSPNGLPSWRRIPLAAPSTPPDGTPATPAADRPVPRPTQMSADLPQPAGDVRHVLVADDEPHIGRIIQMKLEQGPFRVTLAADGREAIDALEHGPPV